ncbi:disulfide bond formation protein B [Pseudoduganella sp. DS3]|uniref:Disulfide bond formation protein B n=2 Tax=Pseudoduganella guangdongensis TaxID=2692179 RepID=A0A6N9HCX0_9BURK|nr:disulfide bond formation protein B [Pseudoduganella guangdongensis]
MTMSNRNVLLAIALVSFGLIGAAMYLQHVLYLMPCPLCVIQRYLFIAVGLAALVGALTSKPKLGAGVGLLAALGGLGVAGKQLYVLSQPSLSCGIDPMETMLNKIPTAEYLPWLFYAEGLCQDAKEKFMGLQVPTWAFIWFGILAAVTAWAMLRKRA